MTVTVTKIGVIAGIVTEKGSVTKSVIAIVTVIVKEKESRKNPMGNTHSTTTRTKWTTTIWKWWIEVRSVDLLFQLSINSQLLDQFRYIKIQPHATDLSRRLWGINLTKSVVIPQSLVSRFSVLGSISIYQKWSVFWGLSHAL